MIFTKDPIDGLDRRICDTAVLISKSLVGRVSSPVIPFTFLHDSRLDLAAMGFFLGIYALLYDEYGRRDKEVD